MHVDGEQSVMLDVSTGDTQAGVVWLCDLGYKRETCRYTDFLFENKDIEIDGQIRMG